MQLHFEIEECVVAAKANPWIMRTVSVQGFSRPIKVEFCCPTTGGREIDHIREDVVKQVANWLRNGAPVVGASDWILRNVWTVIL